MISLKLFGSILAGACCEDRGRDWILWQDLSPLHQCRFALNQTHTTFWFDRHHDDQINRSIHCRHLYYRANVPTRKIVFIGLPSRLFLCRFQRWFDNWFITEHSLNLDFFLTQRVSFETWDHKSWSKVGCVAFLFLASLVTRPDRMFFHLSLLKMARNNGSILIGWCWHKTNKVWFG